MLVTEVVVDARCVHRVVNDTVTVDNVLAAHRHLEDVGTTVYYAESVLVIGAGDVGNSYVEGAVSVAVSVASKPLGLAANTIHTSGSLF